MKLTGTIILLAFGLLGGFCCLKLDSDFLYQEQPEKFVRNTENRPDVWFLEKSRWQYSEEFGYEYGPETVYGGSSVKGKVQSCWFWPANARGNMGLIDGNYDEAELKILVFGDLIHSSNRHRGRPSRNYLARLFATLFREGAQA